MRMARGCQHAPLAALHTVLTDQCINDQQLSVRALALHGLRLSQSLCVNCHWHICDDILI